MKSALAYMMVLGDLLSKNKVPATGIKTYPVESKEEVEQLSKRQIAKAKGKNARKNRGRNRANNAPEETAIYAMLRR